MFLAGMQAIMARVGAQRAAGLSDEEILAQAPPADDDLPPGTDLESLPWRHR
jgi:hypothetical protein